MDEFDDDLTLSRRLKAYQDMADLQFKTIVEDMITYSHGTIKNSSEQHIVQATEDFTISFSANSCASALLESEGELSSEEKA